METKSFRIFLCFSLVLLMMDPLAAQVVIRGKVIDLSNGTGLPGVSLLVNDSLVCITDVNGEFQADVHQVPAKIQASYVGYEKKTITVSRAQNVVIELKASQYLLGEVVVTAYETGQKIKDVPGSISLLTHNDLTVNNDVNMVPALNKVPGIYMQTGSYNTNRLTIRGIGSRELFGTSKIRAYFDNIPLTTGDGQTTIEDIDPVLIDRIEIIKGPSSSLYGAGLGGTVLISSFTPAQDQKKIQYQTVAGSYGYFKNALSGEVSEGKIKIAAGVNRIQSNGYRENNHFDRTTGGLTAKTELGKNTSISFLLNYIDLFAQIPSSLDKKTYDENPRQAAASWKATQGFENYKRVLSGLSLLQNIGKSSDLDASVFWSYFNSYERRPFNILTELTRAWGSRVRFSHTSMLFGRKLESMLGYEYYEDRYYWKTIENLNNSEGALLSNNKEGRRNMNFFAKADYTLPTRTIVTAGLNLNLTDYHFTDLYSIDSINNSGSYTFGKTLSPRIGISQPISKTYNLYASLSHGFSPPSLAETLTPSGAINPNIKPETGVNYEVGGRGFLFHSRLYTDLALYSLQVRNLLVAQRTGPDEFIGVNAGKTSHKGIEFSANYSLIESRSGQPELVAIFSYNLSHFFFTDFVDADMNYSGNRLTGVPESEVNAGLDLSLPSGIYDNLSYQFVDKMPVNDDNSVFTDPYHLVGLKAGYRHTFMSHVSMDLYFILDNIFNEKYSPMVQVNATTTAGPPRYFYPGLPRNFCLGLNLGYGF